MKRPPLLVPFLIFVAAACTQPTTFTYQTAAEGDFPSVIVTVVDRTGSVLDVSEAAHPIAPEPGLSNPPGRPDVVRVAWLGGTCDVDVELEVTRGATGPLITRTTRHRQGGCFMDVVGRAAELRFGAPILAGSIQLVDVAEPVR